MATGIEGLTLPFPLQGDETIVVFARRHWLYLYPRLLVAALTTVVPVLALWAILVTLERTDGTVRLVAIAVSVAWLLFWGVRLYFIKYRYDNDIWLVTNQRLIDSVKNHWFHLHVSSADLIDIEDMTVRRSGLAATLFNYGDIECQTAGAVRNFALRGVPQPARIQATIDRLRDQARVLAGGQGA